LISKITDISEKLENFLKLSSFSKL